MCLLEGLTREDIEVEYRGFSANDFLSAGDFPTYFSSRMQARFPEIFEYTQERKTHKTAAHYRAEAAAEAGAVVAPARPVGIVSGDVPLPPGMEVVLDPDLGLGSGIIIPADLLLHYRSWILSMPHTCLLRDTWRFTKGSALLGFTSPSSTLSGMSGTWRSGGCGGISLASLVP
ncbi:hypothetical protein JCGZ_03730 [Jatropha curcas]|uniref:Uncharacterized protein n=1 Tax=Jatropha curcas TaxID=180498 RepID=A0A067KWS7_JATCU|nr:hypothetical protein JCGZ_03730 [Jatropha curcas]